MQAELKQSKGSQAKQSKAKAKQNNPRQPKRNNAMQGETKQSKAEQSRVKPSQEKQGEAVQSDGTQRNAMQRNAMPRNAMPRKATQRHATQRKQRRSVNKQTHNPKRTHTSTRVHARISQRVRSGAMSSLPHHRLVFLSFFFLVFLVISCLISARGNDENSQSRSAQQRDSATAPPRPGDPLPFRRVCTTTEAARSVFVHHKVFPCLDFFFDLKIRCCSCFFFLF